MLTHHETMESDYETRKVALEAALRVGTGLDINSNGTSTDGSIVVKNAELFLDFLKKDGNNG